MCKDFLWKLSPAEWQKQQEERTPTAEKIQDVEKEETLGTSTHTDLIAVTVQRVPRSRSEPLQFKGAFTRSTSTTTDHFPASLCTLCFGTLGLCLLWYLISLLNCPHLHPPGSPVMTAGGMWLANLFTASKFFLVKRQMIEILILINPN